LKAGRLKNEERLTTEDELAVLFRVSQPTIGEALKRPAAQKLISSEALAGGTFASRLRLEDLSEM
jgi:DNA-binding FadR family transcriptional regulator